MTDRLRPRNYVEAAAIISGASALLIAGFLERYRREWREYAAPLSKDMGLQVADTVESIKLAADTYRSEVADRASERGNAERKSVEVVSDSSGMDEWISTSEAAVVLGVTDRRVRQLARGGELAGHRSGGRWQVSRESVLERASR